MLNSAGRKKKEKQIPGWSQTETEWREREAVLSGNSVSNERHWMDSTCHTSRRPHSSLFFFRFFSPTGFRQREEKGLKAASLCNKGLSVEAIKHGVITPSCPRDINQTGSVKGSKEILITGPVICISHM